MVLDKSNGPKTFNQKLENKAQRPTMRPHEFWGISSYLITAIATFGGRYARELFWYDSSIMTLYAFLTISAHKILNFMRFLQ